MDHVTMTVITAAIIIAVPVLLFLIGMAIAAVLYESIFGRRYEIYETPLLPDAKDYPDLLSEPVTFPSDRKYKYTGCYYYDKNYKEYKGLIVFSHGIFDGHLSYLPHIAFFAARGYKVFGFDDTGSHLSGGKSLRGLPQSVIDLDNALKYIEKDNTLPVLLYGHSWGGYAAATVSAYAAHDIRGIFVQSGFERSLDMIEEEGSRIFGGVVRLLMPYVRLYERIKFGGTAKLTASQGAKAATARGTEMMILHSTDDETISLKNSALANVAKNDRITFVTVKNKGHNSVNSDAAVRYRKQLEDRFIEEYHGKGTRRQRVMFYAEHGDKRLYHELDEKLMTMAADFFDGAAAKKPPVRNT